MSTSLHEMYGGTPEFVKTHDHCKSPSCRELGTFQPHDKYPNVKFCEKHAMGLIVATVRAINDGTHSELSTAKT